MTEERIKELAERIAMGRRTPRQVAAILRTVAAEAREEGIGAVLEKTAIRLKIDNSIGVSEPFVLLSDLEIIAERLKE